MKRFLLLFLVLVSTVASAQRLFYSRATPGGPSSYIAIADSDQPFVYLRNGNNVLNTTLSFRGAGTNGMYLGEPTSKLSFLEANVGAGGINYDADGAINLTGGSTNYGVQLNDSFAFLGAPDGVGFLVIGSNVAFGGFTNSFSLDAGNAHAILNNEAVTNNYGIDLANDVSASTHFGNLTLAPKIYVDTKQPLDSDLTAIAGLSPSNNDFLQRKSGVWTNRTIAQVQADLGVGAATWGSITGTLSSQTDLQTALNLKAPLASPALTGTPTTPTAAVGTNTTQIANTALVQSELPYLQSKDYGVVGDNSTDDATALSNAITAAISANKALLVNGTSGNRVFIGTGSTISGATNLTIFGDGSTIVRTTAAINMLAVSTSVRLSVYGIIFQGNNTTNQRALSIGTCKECDIYNNRFVDLDRALLGNASSFETIFTFSVPIPSSFHHNKLNNVTVGVDLAASGEYWNISDNLIDKSGTYGIWCKAGNVAIDNNMGVGNNIGVFIDGVYNSGNTDHGRITNNTFNHNRQAGIVVKSTQYNFQVTGNTIYATLGDGTGAGNYSTYGTSIGIMLVSADAVNVTGNTFGLNKVNIGYDGMTNSVISSNTFICNSSFTTNNVKSFGFASEKYTINGLNTIVNNMTIGTMAASNTKWFEPNTTAGKEQGVITSGNNGTTSPLFVALTSGSTAFDLDGNINTVYMTTGYTGTFTVRTGRTQQLSTIHFNSIAAATKAITFANNGATTITSFTPGATVSSLTVTLNRTGQYTIVPLSGDNYAIFGDSNDGALTSGTFPVASTGGKLIDSGLTTTTLTSGTYTPTLTNTTNVAASTAYVTGYHRIGNSVTVYGKIDIDVTLAASAATEIGVSLPVASNLAAEQDAGGSAVSDSVASLSARIKADATNDRVSIVFKALSLTNDSYNFEFSYQVK